MGVPNTRFKEGDVYFSYPDQDVMFRYDISSKKCFRKFLGDSTETEVSQDNKLLNDAILYGKEITKSKFDKKAKS